MPLTLLRRHRRDCSAGRPEDSFTNEYEERKKDFGEKCNCDITMSGSLGKKHKRRSTGQWEWDKARKKAEAQEKLKSWDEAAVPPAEPVPPSTPGRKSIVDATKLFETGKLDPEEKASLATQRKWTRLMLRINEYSKSRGYVMIDQWLPEDAKAFRLTLKQASLTKDKTMGDVRSFFESCLDDGWIDKNPIKKKKASKNRDAKDKKNDQKFPFTDEELHRMSLACAHYGGPRYAWTGQDVLDFINLSCYTGLRISDVCLFHISQLGPEGRVQVRTTKTGAGVFTWIPEWLQKRVQERALLIGPHIFGTHQPGTDLDSITDLWRGKLREVWAMCGPWSHPPTPHRFRHTWARILLQSKGATVRNVAELLGITEEMVRQRYSAWIVERQDELTQVIQQAIKDRSVPAMVGAITNKPRRPQQKITLLKLTS